MCTPKPPKVKPTSPEAKTPEPAVIRNPYLDNVTSFGQARMGRRQLRIDRAPSGLRIPVPPIPLPSSADPSPVANVVPIRTGATPAPAITRIVSPSGPAGRGRNYEF